MTYYDELGLTRKASAEEIHDAYKQLARLLHPDRLQDERQRILAESQMKRLNHLYGILSDPHRRREYDLSIHEFPPRPEIVFVPDPPPRRHRTHHRGWTRPAWEIRFRRQVEKHSIVLAALAGAFVTYLLAPGPEAQAPHEVVASVEQEPAAAPTVAGAPTSSRLSPPADNGLSVLLNSLRGRLHQAESERDHALARLRMLEKKIEDAAAGRPAPVAEIATAAPPVPESVALAAPPPPAAPKPATGNRPLTGRWYYVKPAGGEPAHNLYPPEYIELAVVDDGANQIRGRYRARYRVTDRAISPEVVFQFAGGAGRDSAVLSWTGAGGAAGEVRIRLLSANKMELAWVASDLGQHQGLGYGTAILVRRQEP